MFKRKTVVLGIGVGVLVIVAATMLHAMFESNASDSKNESDSGPRVTALSPELLREPEGRYLVCQAAYEQAWTEKITKALCYVEGVQVTVNVELDPQLQHTEHNVEYDPKAVAIETVDERETSTSNTEKTSGGTRSGKAARQRNTRDDPRRMDSQLERTYSDSKYVTSQKQEWTSTAPLVPVRVNVVIGVPDSYYLKVWRHRRRSSTDQEARVPDDVELLEVEQEFCGRIEDVAASLLPSLPPGMDVYPQVKVVTFDDLNAPTVSAQ